jgi:hypothetical protein
VSVDFAETYFTVSTTLRVHACRASPSLPAPLPKGEGSVSFIQSLRAG